VSQAGVLDVDSSNPQIPTQFDTDSGPAIPIANVLEIVGGPGIETSGSGNTVTISLTGGGAGIDSITVDAFTAPGTNPVEPDGTGLITVTGAQVVSGTVGTNVIRSNSLSANAYTMQIQQAGSAGVSTTNLNGVAHFNSTQFTVSNGFVSLTGGGSAIDSIQPNSGIIVAPNASGLVNILGSGSTTTIGTFNTLTVELTGLTNHAVLIGDGTSTIKKLAVGTNGQVLIGSTTADPAFATITSTLGTISFTLGANSLAMDVASGGFLWADISGAFSPLAQRGYFITGTATGTLPAAPANGDTIKFFVDHASQVLTIQAANSKIIRFGDTVSAANGTAVSTLQGDSVELVYRSTNNCWCAIAGFTGVWNVT